MHSHKLKQACYKYLVLPIISFGFFLFSGFGSSDSWEFTEKESEICVYNYNKETDIQAYILVQEQMGEDSLFICIDSEIFLFSLPACEQKIPKSRLKNQIMINNHSIPLKSEIHNISLSLLYPDRVIMMQKEKMKYYVIELCNMSYTSIGDI